MPTRQPIAVPQLRATTVGAVSAGTGILAHAQGHGALPGTGGLLIVAAAGLALGTVARTTTRLLPLLAAGQVLVHLLLIALTGHHHQLLTAPMLAVHAAGTVAALVLVLAAEHLVHAAGGLALRLAALAASSSSVELRPRVGVPAIDTPRAPALRLLGTIGTRGPPGLSKSILSPT